MCGCNEHEQAVGPGVGEDQENSVCVFPLNASGPLWNRCSGRDPRPELRDTLQVAGAGVSWELAPATSAREALALTHWKPLVTYIDLNDTITNVDPLSVHSFSQLLWHERKKIGPKYQL